MKELIYVSTEDSVFNGVKYAISTFLDLYNYKILRGTNLANRDSFKQGQLYSCKLDVKYNSKKKDFVFYVTDVTFK